MITTKRAFTPIQPIDAPSEELTKRLDTFQVPRQASVPQTSDKAGVKAKSAGSKTRRVALDVSESLWEQLALRSIKNRCTVRHLVLKALVKDGFQVEPADLVEDGRTIR